MFLSRRTFPYASTARAPISKKNQQNGSSLVLAIFVLVVMLLLGTALVRMLATSSQSIAYEVLGARAYQAANIGVQDRLATLFPIGTSPQYCLGIDISLPDPGDSPVVANYLTNIANVDGLNNCIVSELSCTDFKVDDVVYYQVRSTGQCTAGDITTSRTIEVEARSL